MGLAGTGPTQAPPPRRWLTLLAFIATLHLLLLYGLPGGFRLALLIGLGIFYVRAGALAATATTASLGLATLLCAVAIQALGLDRAIYYRPHEQLVRQDPDHGHRAYQRNARIEMVMPHGDLKALTGADLAQPRQVVFQTDGEGFRNDRPYQPGQWVIVGDSFVVGMGDTQADILSAQLSRDHGVPAYNLGHPGDISDYLATWRAFRARHPGPVRGVLFLFEGNDFETDYRPARTDQPGFLERWAGRYRGMFTGSDMYRVTKSLYKRAARAGDIAASDSIRVVSMAGRPMGLYAPYVSVSQRREFTMPAAMTKDLEELAAQVEQIFFIPTNYRVYARHLGQPALPHAQWQTLSTLCERHGWHCTDLTPALVAASNELLERGEFTWWLDDTHWNRTGISVAARVVAERLRAHAGQAF